MLQDVMRKKVTTRCRTIYDVFSFFVHTVRTLATRLRENDNRQVASLEDFTINSLHYRILRESAYDPLSLVVSPGSFLSLAGGRKKREERGVPSVIAAPPRDHFSRAHCVKMRNVHRPAYRGTGEPRVRRPPPSPLRGNVNTSARWIAAIGYRTCALRVAPFLSLSLSLRA